MNKKKVIIWTSTWQIPGRYFCISISQSRAHREYNYFEAISHHISGIGELFYLELSNSTQSVAQPIKFKVNSELKITVSLNILFQFS